MRRSKTLQWAALALLLAGAGLGCASQSASFRPARGVTTATTASGRHVAYYVVRLDNSVQGTVKVWSQGGYELSTQRGRQPVLDVRMSIRNDTDAPITLDVDRTDLDVYLADGSVTMIRAPLQESGSDTVDPGAMGRITLIYPLPHDVLPGDVDQFDLNWSVMTVAGSYSESTPFRQRYYNGSIYVYQAYPYYGPGWYGWPYYGPGWIGPPFGGGEFGPEGHETHHYRGREGGGERERGGRGERGRGR
jgi:hypothetical protein